MKASYASYLLDFKRPSGTSRGVLHQKETFFLKLEEGDKVGYGECGLFRGLSADDRTDYESRLQWVCEHIHLGLEALWEANRAYPSIQFGLEQAFLSLARESPFVLFPSAFVNGEAGIPINGLVWMGDIAFMEKQIAEKIEAGFSCIKLKIGVDFEKELDLLAKVRRSFSKSDIELRVDANGAFTPDLAMDNLKRLAELDLHSIEQPIKQGQWDAMAHLCAETPLPIALDEELIGIGDVTEKQKLLQTIQPHYIILKPSLIGGFKGSTEWIQGAEKLGIGWWVTSALESNVGLNAIAQWTFGLHNPMPQGLGTGALFTNNIQAPLAVEKGKLWYTDLMWNRKILDNLCL
ncbi:o-succinylbenzoate synthase [Sediminicola luteus]|uniref:O-succinylbenzoate synthase n=1 Tax=Sediminicola luteus TaxID=319238 RepID=A0A2A4G7C8_9FLAO|nr:o-succinylbenzoate synthase [Sediminicola luteus]PCE63880.1 o-succinylbenzoate synthase [Sediminicola luteus]